MPNSGKFTKLLLAVQSGDHTAQDELTEALYSELRKLANSYLQQERANHTLQPTALVHEAYLRLVGQERVTWQNRDHFIGVAARIMRRVLVDYARGHNRKKRGGGDYKLPLAEADRFFTNSTDVDLLALDDALKKFAVDYPRESQIVDLRFFGGLTIAETARLLRVSHTTVELDWDFAKAWLRRELSS